MPRAGHFPLATPSSVKNRDQKLGHQTMDIDFQHCDSPPFTLLSALSHSSMLKIYIQDVRKYGTYNKVRTKQPLR